MPTEPIPFGANLESGNSQLGGAPPVVYNVMVDGRGVIRRRPGIGLWSGYLGVSLDGWAVEGMASLGSDALVAVTARRTMFRIVGGVASSLSPGGAGSLLPGLGRPIFAETRSRLVIAGGAEPCKVEPTAIDAAFLGGSPPRCTHVAAMASRLFVDDSTAGSTYEGRLRYSGTGATGEETWDALDTFDTEAAPDDVVAVHTDSNELWCFGKRTLQVYQPDPYSIVAPRIAKRVGCSAPYSVIGFDNQFAWLNHKREFVISDGRGITPISGGIDATIDALGTVSDCFGFRLVLGQYEILAWHFPTEARTFAWQVGGGWSEWSGWTDTLGHTPLDITSGYYWEDQNANLLGTSLGRVAAWDLSRNDDFTAFTYSIKAVCTTGFVDRGTAGVKECDAVRVICKGQASGSRIRLSWRDDLGTPVAPLEFELSGDAPVIEVRGLGTYRMRQWTLDMTDAAELQVARVEEDFRVNG